ncbi:MAG: HDOD domain-containing protein, partial [Candidatus Hydrogenedentes bacterium]|nr:HDOD domain-containing protein [Candidatus Hydrogenedentota bacterium]
INEEQLSAAVERQKREGGRIVQNLIALESIDADTFTRFLSRQRGLPRVEIARYGVPHDILSLIPRDFAVQHEVFPLDLIGGNLTVGMVCPLDTATIAQLNAACGFKISPVLCSAEDLRASIERYYAAPEESKQDRAHEAEVPAEAISVSLKLAGIQSLIQQLTALPSLPITIHKLREAIDDPQTSAKEIGGIIATDPPLAAKLLSIANSPAYGFPHQITSVPLAVSLLGLNETYSVALSAAVVDLFKGSPAIDFKSFWVRSMLCGTLCKIIARVSGLGATPGIFTAGILLDIGRLAFAEVAPQRYASVDPNLRGADLVAAEERVFGIAHPEAGYLLASAWGLPDELGETIRFHHTPEYAQLNRSIASLAAIGNMMAFLTPEERKDPGCLSNTCARPLAELHLNEDATVELFDELCRILSSEFLLQRKWESDARRHDESEVVL